MNFINNTDIQLSNNGFKYVVEESKSFQTSAYIKKDFFAKYITKFRNTNDEEVIESESVSIGVNLNSFTDVLAGLVDNDLSNMNISYYHRENRLLFTITQVDDDTGQPAGELRTEFYLKTMHSNEPFAYDTSNDQTLSHFILGASEFHSILSDFDKSEELEFKISPRRLTLRSIGSQSHHSVVKIAAISEVFFTYEFKEESKYAYKYSYFKMIMRALVLASKVAICVFGNGLMRVQLMVRTDDDEDASLAFVEYIMHPSLSDDTDED